MDVMSIVWLCSVIGFAVLEVSTATMLCIWFSIASLPALAGALLGVPIWLQLALFIVCSAVLLLFTRPIAKRLMNNRPAARTNADRVIGMTGLVTEEINNDIPAGLVKVSGQMWSARSVSGAVIPSGSKVVVSAIEGVKLMVDEALEIQSNSKEVAQCQQ